MLQSQAQLKNLRIAPRKVRMVADLVRRKSALEAQTILNFTIKKGARDLSKLLESALDAAKKNLHLEVQNLYIKKLTVNEGTKLRRWMPRARGSATPLQLKTSHINIILGEIEGVNKSEAPVENKSIQASQSKHEVFGGDKPRFKQEKEKLKPKVETGKRKIFKRQVF